MLRLSITPLVVALFMGLASCQSNPSENLIEQFEEGSRFFLTTNLHVDPLHNRIRSQNFVWGRLLPMCSEVRVQSVDADSLNFIVIASGQLLKFMRDEELLEPFGEHLDRYFGEQCDRTSIDALSAVDQKGIASGEIMIGMTKAGVLLAVGYPPEHMNSTLDAGRWVYSKNKWTLISVHFDENSIVSRIDE
ncbi:MAG: hypothetical protein ACI8TQ_000496 [Planctomycetota bacterium]|jgi:hypothetical protein